MQRSAVEAAILQGRIAQFLNRANLTMLWRLMAELPWVQSLPPEAHAVCVRNMNEFATHMAREWSKAPDPRDPATTPPPSTLMAMNQVFLRQFKVELEHIVAALAPPPTSPPESDPATGNEPDDTTTPDDALARLRKGRKFKMSATITPSPAAATAVAHVQPPTPIHTQRGMAPNASSLDVRDRQQSADTGPKMSDKMREIIEKRTYEAMHGGPPPNAESTATHTSSSAPPASPAPVVVHAMSTDHGASHDSIRGGDLSRLASQLDRWESQVYTLLVDIRAMRQTLNVSSPATAPASSDAVPLGNDHVDNYME